MEHIIFEEENPWKVKIEAYWTEKGCKTRRADWKKNTLNNTSALRYMKQNCMR